jgi:hypothetical protein
LAFVALAILVGVIVILAMSEAKDNDLTAYTTFASATASMLAVVLALVSIGHSMKDADVHIFLGDKRSTASGNLQEVKVRNRGNAMGNMASVFVEIDVQATSPISFAGAEGLRFLQTGNLARKQYRFDDAMNPRPLYPGEYIFSHVGFIQAPTGTAGLVKFSVQIIGTQGRTRREFQVNM